MSFAIATPTLLVAAIIALALIAAVAMRLSIRRKARRAVYARAALSSTQFAALFTDPKEAEVSVAIRDRLRDYISIDPALVRPDDKLCADLQLAAIDGLDANSFVAEVERVTKTDIPDEVAERMLTLRDIVSFVARARRESAT